MEACLIGKHATELCKSSSKNSRKMKANGRFSPREGDPGSAHEFVEQIVDVVFLKEEAEYEMVVVSVEHGD